MMDILQFTCDFDVVKRGSEHSTYLLHHLDQKTELLFCSTFAPNKTNFCIIL